jgi:hypothetical protein
MQVDTELKKYKEEWDRISSDGTKEKIINYYEDY